MSTSLAFPATKETWVDGRFVYPAVVTIAASGASFPATTAHSLPPTAQGGSLNEIWIVKVIYSDGTDNYVSGSTFYTGHGIQGWRVGTTNVESAEDGTMTWTSFTADVHLEYTIS